METNSNILSYDILSEMEQLQICGGQIGNPDNPDDINYYCNNAKCSQCSCLNPIKAGLPVSSVTGACFFGSIAPGTYLIAF